MPYDAEKQDTHSLPRQTVLTLSCILSLCETTRRNLVATVNLECKLDLKTIALHARNAEYNPKVSLAPLVRPSSRFRSRD